MAEVDVDVEGLRIAALLSSADGYKPMVLRRSFERLAAALAEQAYWLSWLESIEALAPVLAAARFKTPNRRKGERIQTPVWAPGAAPSARDLARFEAARKRALAKLHGKGSPSEDEVAGRAFGGWSYDHEMGAASREKVMLAAMGPQLFAYAKSKCEKKELDLESQVGSAEIKVGGSAPPRL